MSNQGILFPLGIFSPLFDGGALPQRAGKTTANSGGNMLPPRYGNMLPAARGSTLGERWAALLAHLYPAAHADKSIARDFNVAPRTARGWRSGQTPHPEAFETAIALCGAPLVLQVLDANYKEASTTKLHDQLAMLEAQLTALRQELAENHHARKVATR